jgi:hypothetical protein
MPSNHSEYSSVSQALEGVLQVADYLEAERGKAERVNQVIHIQEKLFNLPFKLVQPYRSFVREGEVMSEPDSKTPTMKLFHFFLFNDLLLQTSPKKNRYKCVRHFELQHTKAVALPKETKPNSFRILTQDTGYSFTTNNSEEKNGWVDAINNTAFDYKKNEHNRRVASQKPFNAQ